MPKALVTGHRGFIGRHFVDHLSNSGYEVTGVDIKEGDDCRAFFWTNDERFDLVVHCAAIVGGRATIEGNPMSVAADLSIDAEMFNWALHTKQPRIVYFSSSAAYPTYMQGSPFKLPETAIDLDSIANPDMTYGWAKLTGEYLAQFVKNQGVEVYVFRPFSGYGEDQDLDYPFPSFIQRVKNAEDPFVIWGNGEQVRDFIHVDDIVNAVMTAVRLKMQGPINLGTGVPTSFNALASLMLKMAQLEPKIEHLYDKPVGVFYRCADISRLTGFYTPKISLATGIARALA